MKTTLTIINVALLMAMAALTAHVLTLERMLKETQVSVAHHEAGLREIGGEVGEMQTRLGTRYESSVLQKSKLDDRMEIGAVKI